MLFQIASDIHTEFYNIDAIDFPYITPKAEYLLLAGDIGCPNTHKETYIKFLDETSRNFKKIFLIAGNHEMYNGNIQDTLELSNSLI